MRILKKILQAVSRSLDTNLEGRCGGCIFYSPSRSYCYKHRRHVVYDNSRCADYVDNDNL